jgi:hypothetical protein
MEDTNLLFDFVPVTTHHACYIDSLAYMLLDFLLWSAVFAVSEERGTCWACWLVICRIWTSSRVSYVCAFQLFWVLVFWNLSRVLKSLEVTCRCQETLAASSGLCAKCQTQVKGRPTPGQVNDRTINTRKAWLCSREQCLSTSANQIDYLEGNTCYCEAMIVNRVEHISIPGKLSSLARVCGS